uniref:Galactose mutarotase n=1 Tax=Megaselia scalaris TaxID=36166 RepID=T1GJZ9_MEGSC
MVVEIFEDLFGSTVDPLDKKTKDIRRFTFSNSDTKASVQVITWGATITSLKVADNKGNISDIVCGFDDIKGYQKENNPYFGATIGRICNRVANGRFTLEGKEINVSKNWNNKHELHGGFIGFDKVVWDIVQVDKKGGSVTLSHINPDGHEGYPGELKATVIFKMNKSGSFQVTFLATTNKTTAVNLTNHSYFNLAGHDTGSSKLYEHLIKINADKITITDEDSIPTGGFMDVENTPFDLRQIDNLGPGETYTHDVAFTFGVCED